jgi:hypothetical protein
MRRGIFEGFKHIVVALLSVSVRVSIGSLLGCIVDTTTSHHFFIVVFIPHSLAFGISCS